MQRSVPHDALHPGPSYANEWAPDQHRTTPQVRRAALHPGHGRLSPRLHADMVEHREDAIAAPAAVPIAIGNFVIMIII
jgi:hypothetical protein